MGLTKAEWYLKLKTWVPGWMFSNKEQLNKAVFMAIAKLLADREIEVSQQTTQTFIDEATGDILDQHGAERDIARLPGELDPSYQTRIRTKSLVFNGSVPAIQALVSALVIRGVAVIKEDWQGSIFCNSGSFLNRAEIILEPIENAFSIVVDKQIHDPYSFADREFFCNREAFAGIVESSEQVFELILQAVNENKASGTTYRILERLS